MSFIFNIDILLAHFDSKMVFIAFKCFFSITKKKHAKVLQWCNRKPKYGAKKKFQSVDDYTSLSL